MKHLLRYLKGTVARGLEFGSKASLGTTREFCHLARFCLPCGSIGTTLVWSRIWQRRQRARTPTYLLALSGTPMAREPDGFSRLVSSQAPSTAPVCQPDGSSWGSRGRRRSAQQELTTGTKVASPWAGRTSLWRRVRRHTTPINVHGFPEFLAKREPGRWRDRTTNAETLTPFGVWTLNDEMGDGRRRRIGRGEEVI